MNESVTQPVEFQDTSPCKRYRFVVTGHGKYEKVSADGCEDTNGQTGKSCSFLCKNTHFWVSTEIPLTLRDTRFFFFLKK